MRRPRGPPQALGQQQFQLVAEPLAPMAQVRTLVRESVLEELFAGEELEIRVMDPALAHALIGQPVNVFEQQQPDHEAGLDPRPATLAVERGDLAVDPVPVDLAGKQNQLVLHVDDLVQPRPEQVIRSRRLVLLRPHRPLRCATESWLAAKGNPQTKLQGLAASTFQSLQSQTASNPKNRLPLNRLEPCSRATDYKYKAVVRLNRRAGVAARSVGDSGRLDAFRAEKVQSQPSSILVGLGRSRA